LGQGGAARLLHGVSQIDKGAQLLALKIAQIEKMMRFAAAAGCCAALNIHMFLPFHAANMSLW
jgi:hypothetical protein